MLELQHQFAFRPSLLADPAQASTRLPFGDSLTVRGEYRCAAITRQDLRPYRATPGVFAGKWGIAMNSISATAMHFVPAATVLDQSLKTVALLSCLGLAASVCAMTFGLDLSAGLF